MKTTADQPADTRMMNIVHNALRRDLRRAELALASPSMSAAQLRAIATHLDWMMQFLRAHHRAEDVGLYPLVRERDASLAELLDAMDTDHVRIAAAIADVEDATRSIASNSSDEPQPLIAALDRLEQVLLPHLAREEDEVMPHVSAIVTAAEWKALEYEHNLKGKSFAQLGREGHWLIDDASPDDRRAVLGLVPAMPRFVLVHGFATTYRREAASRWGAPARPPRRVQTQGLVDVWIDATVDALWEIVRDVTRVGEWSHECRSVMWLDGATSAAPGARFRGRNQQGVFRWGRVCEIIRAQPYELVWRTLPTALYPDSTEWKIVLTPEAGGTRIEQSFQAVRAPKALSLVYAVLVPAHRDRDDALTEDLRRLGELAVPKPTASSSAAGVRSDST